MSSLRAIDLHAHVDATIAPGELDQLGAVVFVATRSLDEADTATLRHDEGTVWGVGCHPSLVGAHKAFNSKTFATLLGRTAFASEIGLDGSSRVPMARQQETLGAILAALQDSPRIASLHSYKATGLLVEQLAAQPIKGAVLHWWLGDAAETRRALELGCFFSINASSVRRAEILELLPLDRIITETDHPFGDRRAGSSARPGLVDTVEQSLARHYGCSKEQIRLAIWENLARLTSVTGCAALLPRRIRLELMAL